MRTNICIVLFVFAIMSLCCSTKPKFEHYGVYVANGTGFRELQGFEFTGLNDTYIGSKKYNDTPLTTDTISIYVYSPNAKTMQLHLLGNPRLRGGDFECGNWSIGYRCEETKILVYPEKENNEMIRITAPVHKGVYILHDRNANKGYIFTVK